MPLKTISFLFFIFFIFSCRSEKSIPYSFYYWRTEFSLDTTEKQALEKCKSENLYLRFFDISRENGNFQPIGMITKSPIAPKISQNIVPVIFITNQTWKGITSSEIQFLAHSIEQKIKEICLQNQWAFPSEIQIDSDWTVATRDDYFLFLKTLKALSPKKISCTLRLHQIKDKENTGIPPVDKGYLMCYATSSPLDNATQNSILDLNVLKSYLSQIEQYPLSFDIALPIYSWGIITNHLGKKKLINAVTSEELTQNKKLKKISDSLFEVIEDGFYFGFYLNKGFRIKVEEISQENLNESLEFLQQKININQVIYYHLDSKFVKNYTQFQ